MGNVAEIEKAKVSACESDTPRIVSIRVSPNAYFSALFSATFFAAFLIYLEYDLAALVVFAVSWLSIPYFLWTDKIIFDGRYLSRNGILPRLWATLNNSRKRIRVSDIEQVETQAIRALKRGGNVFYRYRTSVHGKGLRFAFASGGEDYRQMIQNLFTVLPENVLDSRSIELRDYLKDPKEILMKAEFAKIPSASVLEDSWEFSSKDRQKTKKNLRQRGKIEIEDEKVEYLRQLANELRLSGYLLQAMEAFRRALILKPQDNWILFEFARCLSSLAGTQKDKRLEKRAVAALRLAEKRAGEDSELLSRLGESYFQFGLNTRARKSFEKSQEKQKENFRSIRGLAEISLREGKIAYVIHHFSAVNQFVETNSLRRWARGEAEYFTRLNSDEEYRDLEISRIKLFESLSRSRKSVLRLTFLGFPVILAGILLNDAFIANFGWAVSFLSLTIWIALILTRQLFCDRIPFHLFDNDGD